MNTDREELLRLYPEIRVDADWTPRTYVRPTEKSLIFFHEPDHIHAGLAAFGLIPAWKEDRKTHFENARSETVWEKPTFRDLIPDYRRRCLVPVTGFWEWDSRKVRHLIRPRDPNGLFYIAGIHSHWTRLEKGSIWCFALLTVDSNKAVAKVHDRMPVILDHKAAWYVWMNPYEKIPAIKEILRPADPSETIVEERPTGPVQESLL